MSDAWQRWAYVNNSKVQFERSIPSKERTKRKSFKEACWLPPPSLNKETKQILRVSNRKLYMIGEGYTNFSEIFDDIRAGHEVEIWDRVYQEDRTYESFIRMVSYQTTASLYPDIQSIFDAIRRIKNLAPRGREPLELKSE